MKTRRVPMTVEEYHDLPLHPGWKCEYWDGMAHIRPREIVALIRSGVRPFAAESPLPSRPPTPQDRAALVAAYLDAFDDSPDFCDATRKYKREQAERDVRDFFSGRRGPVLDASRVAVEEGGEVAGAALVLRLEQGPYQDLLFVRPRWQRRGLATALLSAIMTALHAAGERELYSGYHLANEPSIAFHARHGFEELPDLHLTELRLRCVRHECERAGKTDAERAALETECRYLSARVEELRAVQKREGFEAVAPILRFHVC